MIPLSPLLVENFAGVFLSEGYDDAQPTPPFHRECWEMYCSDEELVAIAAPRGHAKTTALTQNFGLAAVLFRFEPHVMLVGSSEELAMGLLGDMAKQLRENDDLRAEFGVKRFITDSKGEIIVECDDGYQFRILARGVEQRVRGIKWNGRRPGLILGDDIEEDEQVENSARRRKVAKWVNRALIPMGRRGCKVRFCGTILHQDSLLAGLMKDASWTSRLYRAHTSFDDFSSILWPEAYSEARLKKIRARYVSKGDAGGYAQEYLNDPQDDGVAFLKREWFLPMTPEDHESSKIMGVGVDFAISTKDSANRTSFTIGGQDTRNILSVVDVRVGRMDSEEIVETFFDIQSRWHPEYFWVESGQIWLAVKPVLTKEMLRRGHFINFIERQPIKDKKARGTALQKRMRVGAVHFDKDTDWYAGFEEELRRFTGETEALLDDQFDSTALWALGFESLPDVEDEDVEVLDEDEWAARRFNRSLHHSSGRSPVTGY